ncbi:hypothetical protein [Pseudonocardia acidicola]|uniref:Uncharacterized protein n=1 Tax=Pseudonocardia acidicola TaxID=2724939 RepID=A0ABX1SJ92_9PSEU|nr:hypothetical protein [Pseudonocardia acidicola]NMH95726.1 hypothetical protein [Pseudonocardia acidicola]NMI00199.1 hypothetical protein [Pseudonocardia acidicola]
MSSARHGIDNDGRSSWSDAQAAYQSSCTTQSRQAARVVAGRAIDLDDCTELLAMLGLDARTARSA